MLAELVDAVVGVDTHRDTHQVEIALPNGAPIASTTISNDTTGYAELLAWIVDHAPGPRLAVSIEGTRSYGVGLARAAAAAGLRRARVRTTPPQDPPRASGKSDPIDAHLAVLTALRLDADRLPTPRADGDREALRILLGARQELTTTSTAQTNRLRALLLGGRRHRPPARPRRAHRHPPGRPGPPPATPRGQPRAGRTARRDPPPRPRPARSRPRAQGQPRPAADHRQRPRPRAHRPSRHRPGQRRPGHRVVLPPRPLPQRRRVRRPRRRQPAYRPAAGAPCGTGSTAAATAPSTGRCTPSPRPGCAAARPPRPTSPGAPPKARPPRDPTLPQALMGRQGEVESYSSARP